MTDKLDTRLVGAYSLTTSEFPILARVDGDPDRAVVSLAAVQSWTEHNIAACVRAVIDAEREHTQRFVIADLARKGHLKNAPEVLDGPLDAFADRLAESLANALASVEQRTAIVSMPSTTATVRRDARGDLVGIDAEPTA